MDVLDRGVPCELPSLVEGGVLARRCRHDFFTVRFGSCARVGSLVRSVVAGSEGAQHYAALVRWSFEDRG